VSRYDRFRRRLAPIALLVAIALLARDSCGKDKRTHTTVVLELGALRPQVREVQADVVVDGETIATYRRTALPGALIDPCRFAMVIPGDTGELRIDLDLGGAHRQVTKKFQAIEGSSMLVTIPDGDSR